MDQPDSRILRDFQSTAHQGMKDLLFRKLLTELQIALIRGLRVVH